jgi:AcrR family transcriptional regulator
MDEKGGFDIMAVSGDARSVRSRKALRDALLALLEEKPFDQVTIREITGRARVGYATFFRHFSAKEDLLNDLAAGQIAELLALTLPPFHTYGSRDALQALCSYVHERKTLWAALLTGGAAGTVRDEFIRQARVLATTYPPQTHWLPRDLATVYGTGGTIDVLAWWLSQDEIFPAEMIADILDRLVITPVLRGITITDLDRQTLAK